MDAVPGATESTTVGRSAARRTAAESRAACYGRQMIGLPSVGVRKTDSSTSGDPLAAR